MSGNAELVVKFRDQRSVDVAAWDAHVNATSGNPTQLAAFGALGGALRTPVYAEVRRRSEVVMRWLFYRAGLRPGLSYLDIRSEPTSNDPALVDAVLRAAMRRFRPFRIAFKDIVCNRWHSAEALTALGFDSLYPHGTVALDLRRGRAALRADMQKRFRQAVNRGARDGLVLEEQSNVAAVARLYPLAQATLGRGGAAVPRRDYVRAHAAALCPIGYGRLFFATRDGTDYGALFIFVAPKLALAWLEGTRDDAPSATTAFLHWSVIERCLEQGVAVFDLGGADVLAPPDSKGARILEKKQRHGGILTRHCGGIRTLGPTRAAVYDGLMRRLRHG